MKELIPRKYKNGIQLKEGDIIAESEIGKSIWDGQAIITSRPLGIVVVYHHPQLKEDIEPEETDSYNIKEIRCGTVKFTDKAKEWMKERLNGNLYLSKYDGKFYAWDNIEVIGNIYDLDE